MAWRRADTVSRAAGVASGPVDDEVVVFAPATGSTLGLSGTGVWLWQMVAAPITLDGLIVAAMEQFQVPRSACAPDITATLGLLLEQGMIEVEHP